MKQKYLVLGVLAVSVFLYARRRRTLAEQGVGTGVKLQDFVALPTAPVINW